MLSLGYDWGGPSAVTDVAPKCYNIIVVVRIFVTIWWATLVSGIQHFWWWGTSKAFAI